MSFPNIQLSGGREDVARQEQQSGPGAAVTWPTQQIHQPHSPNYLPTVPIKMSTAKQSSLPASQVNWKEVCGIFLRWTWFLALSEGTKNSILLAAVLYGCLLINIYQKCLILVKITYREGRPTQTKLYCFYYNWYKLGELFGARYWTVLVGQVAIPDLSLTVLCSQGAEKPAVVPQLSDQFISDRKVSTDSQY